jgi:hypothetical protein
LANQQVEKKPEPKPVQEVKPLKNLDKEEEIVYEPLITDPKLREILENESMRETPKKEEKKVVS